MLAKVTLVGGDGGLGGVSGLGGTSGIGELSGLVLVKASSSCSILRSDCSTDVVVTQDVALLG